LLPAFKIFLPHFIRTENNHPYLPYTTDIESRQLICSIVSEKITHLGQP
jgi:hypothetical protein